MVKSSVISNVILSELSKSRTRSCLPRFQLYFLVSLNVVSTAMFDDGEICTKSRDRNVTYTTAPRGYSLSENLRKVLQKKARLAWEICCFRIINSVKTVQWDMNDYNEYRCCELPSICKTARLRFKKNENGLWPRSKANVRCSQFYLEPYVIY